METNLTEEQFELFKNHVKYMQTFLGLSDWDIVAEATLDRTASTQAQCAVDPVARQATLTLNMWNVDDSSDANVANSATHEVLHVLLADLEWPLRDAVKDREDADALLSRFESASHAVINRLLRVIAPRQ